MVIFYTNDWESGDVGQCTTISIQNAVWPQISDFSYTGLYSVRRETKPVTAWAHSLCSIDITPLQRANVRNCYYFDSIPINSQLRLLFIERYDPTRTTLATLDVMDQGDGIPRFYLVVRDGDQYVGSWGSPVPIGTYFCVELEWIMGTTGSARLYIGGTNDITIINIDTSLVGEANKIRTGLGKFESVDTSIISCYCDDIAIADEYIGVPIPPQTYSLTYNSLPILVDAVINGEIVISGSTREFSEGQTVTTTVPQTVEDELIYSFQHFLLNGVQQPGPEIVLQITGDGNLSAIYEAETVPPPPPPTDGIEKIIKIAGPLVVGLALKKISE